ncbi:MAG: chitobiase/beta-hexosaminidase C-terminal domain-containing protein [Oscillospiraceae bacterium]|nr:chitobiase/beta-hexosaminidase C-terminal domain-containing protein [Oscillospiraceae bacterium]
MKNRILRALLSLLLVSGFFLAPEITLSECNTVAYAQTVLQAPTSAVKTSAVLSGSKYSVTLKCKTAGATIYYSTGGKYKKYTKPFNITKSTTVKCYSQKNGEKSKTVSLKYTLKPKINVSLSAGTYYTAQNVTLSSPVSGVSLYYTLDGSKPTKSSSKYNGSIKITESSTLRVLAVKKGWTSNYSQVDYTIGKIESLLDDYKSKYLYNTLSSNEKQVYEKIFEGVKNFKEEIDLSELDCDVEGIAGIFYSLKYENPQFFWIDNSWRYKYTGNGKIISFTPSYNMTRSEAEKMQKKLDAAAEQIAQKALKQNDVTERLRIIHDEIIKMTDYEVNFNDRSNGEPDGPLLNGKARCEGYAKAFCYIAQMVGVDALSISGFAEGGSHLWSMVKIDNKWLHVDVTFDDEWGYEYFCIDDKKCGLDHVSDAAASFPSKI